MLWRKLSVCADKHREKKSCSALIVVCWSIKISLESNVFLLLVMESLSSLYSSHQRVVGRLGGGETTLGVCSCELLETWGLFLSACVVLGVGRSDNSHFFTICLPGEPSAVGPIAKNSRCIQSTPIVPLLLLRNSDFYFQYF